MANEHITYVFKSNDSKGADRLMLLAIADYCDQHGSCYPSYQTLAEKCNVTRRAAIDTCQRLEKTGHIYIATKQGFKTENGSTNRFFMTKWRESQDLDNTQFRGEVEDTSEVDFTPGGEADNTPTSEVDFTQTQEVTQEVTQELSPEGDVVRLQSNSGMLHAADKNGKPLCNPTIDAHVYTLHGDIQCKRCLKKLNKPKKTDVCPIDDGMTTDERGIIFDWFAEAVWGYNPDEFKRLSDTVQKTAGGRIGKIIKALRCINSDYGTKLGLEYIKPFWDEFSKSGLDLKSDVKWTERYLAWYQQQKEAYERKILNPKPDYREAPQETSDTYERPKPIQLGRKERVRL